MLSKIKTDILKIKEKHLFLTTFALAFFLVLIFWTKTDTTTRNIASKENNKSRFSKQNDTMNILIGNFKINLDINPNLDTNTLPNFNTTNLQVDEKLSKLIDDQWKEIKSELNLLSKSLCSNLPTQISGPVQVKKVPEELTDVFNVSDAVFEQYFDKNLELGGKWKPANCVARHRVAIIIPYKNRLDNLNSFLFHMHPFLQRQELEYRIFVVEQYNDGRFNKGVLMNSGFIEIFNLYNYSLDLSNDSALYPFDCFVFHDVDLLPEGFIYFYNYLSSQV